MCMRRSKLSCILTLLMILLLIVALTGCGEKKESEPTIDNEQDVKEDAGIPADQLIAKGMATDGFSYEYVLTLPDGQKFTHKMWVKGGNMRSEMETPVGEEPVLSIVNIKEKMVYIYQAEMKQAIAMPLDESEVDTTSPKDFISDSDPSSMIYMKHDTFDGKKCLVYETRNEGGHGKIWISEEYGMPLRVESQVGSDKIVAEFLNFKIGEIDDSLFNLPEGTLIMDFGAF